jgi:hypothetical protein
VADITDSGDGDFTVEIAVEISPGILLRSRLWMAVGPRGAWEGSEGGDGEEKESKETSPDRSRLEPVCDRSRPRSKFDENRCARALDHQEPVCSCHHLSLRRARAPRTCVAHDCDDLWVLICLLLVCSWF